MYDTTQEQSIFGTIRQEINDFVNNYIEVVPGFNFSQYQTIKRCHLYINSHFYDQSLFSGREKIFFNISKYRKDAAATMIDIDTGDCRLYPMNPKSEWSTFLLEKELKLWLKDNNMARKLNEIADQAVSYGTSVVKKTKKGAVIVDLRRLFCDPTVAKIKDSRFITIKHYYTPTQLRKKVKDGWNSAMIEDIIEKKKGQKSFAPQSYENFGQKNPIVSAPYIEIYERYGEVEGSQLDLNGPQDDFVRSLFIVAEPFAIGRSEDGKNQWDDGAVLFKSEWKGDYPFNDYHYSQTPGRWLGIGVIEELFPQQERFNEMANQKRVAMELSAMHIFQTADATVVDNILTDLKSGDLIKTKTQGAIAPLVNEERNLAAFEAEEKSYADLADKVTSVNDLIAGVQLPSSTPATNAAIQNTNSKSFFKQKRQNFAIFLREFFNEFVFPQLVKDLSVDHILRFTGDVSDLQKIDMAYVTALMNDQVFNHIIAGGLVPTSDEVSAMQQGLLNKMKGKGGGRFIDIKKSFYGDTDFEFDLLIDDEQEPSAILAQNEFQLLTALAQNPQLLENPVTKALIYDWAEKVGINPVKLEIAEAQTPPQQPQQQLPQGQQQQIQGQPTGQQQVAQPQPSALNGLQPMVAPIK